MIARLVGRTMIQKYLTLEKTTFVTTHSASYLFHLWFKKNYFFYFSSYYLCICEWKSNLILPNSSWRSKHPCYDHSLRDRNTRLVAAILQRTTIYSTIQSLIYRVQLMFIASTYGTVCLHNMTCETRLSKSTSERERDTNFCLKKRETTLKLFTGNDALKSWKRWAIMTRKAKIFQAAKRIEMVTEWKFSK